MILSKNKLQYARTSKLRSYIYSSKTVAICGILRHKRSFSISLIKLTYNIALVLFIKGTHLLKRLYD
jgi:hypothetical protein